MAKEIKLPELGENVEEAEVLSVLVSEGDSVKADQPLIELETDKATVEFPAPMAGKVGAIRVSEGDRVEIGQVLLEMEPEDDAEGAPEDDEEAGASAAAEEASSPEDREKEQEKQQGTEKKERKRKQEKDPGKEKKDAEAEERKRSARKQEAGEAEAEAGKAEEEPQEKPKRAERRRRKTGGARAPKRREAPEPAPEPPSVPAAPSVRRFARELGVDLAGIEGSGPGGRISVEDVKGHVRERLGEGPARRQRSSAAAGAFLELPDFSRFGEVEREPMSGIRRRTAENMTRSWITIPHVTQHDRADITELESARRRLGPRVRERGGKLTVTAIVIKALGQALRVFPRFNASLDVENEEIVQKHYVNVAVAVDTEHGLLVPVIRDPDRKGLVDIAVELGDLSERARNRKIRPEELQGSNLTVTNLGGLGTTTFTPLINWPEVAVVGIGRADTEAVWRDEGFEARRILPLSVSYDHRLIDGADAARFLRWLAEALEDPLLLAFDS